MKLLNRRLWLLTSIVVVIALVALACGEEATEPTTEPEVMEEAAEETPVEEVMEEDVMEEEAAEDMVMEEEAPVAEEEATDFVLEEEDLVLQAGGLPPVCTPEGAEPLHGGTLTLTGYDPGTYDTSQYNAWEGAATKSFTHNKLITYNVCDPLDSSDLSPYPELAESWEISEDGLTVTFHLRQGIHWPNIPPVNGRELVADDVVFSYGRYMSDGSPHAAILGFIESIEAPDNYTVVYNLKQPWSGLLPYAAYTYFVIEAPEVLEEFGTFETPESVIGTGPWTLVEHEFGVRQYYERNPDYWRGPNGITGENLPYIDNIEVLFVADDAAKMALYRGGELDVGPAYYYWGWWTGDAESVNALQDSPELISDYRPVVEQFTTEVYLVPKLEVFPFMSQKVRQALNMIVDRSPQLWYSGSSVETRDIAVVHPWFVPRDELGEGAVYFPVDANGEPAVDIAGAKALFNEGLQELIDEGLAPERFQIGDAIQVEMFLHRLENVFEENASVLQSNAAELGLDIQFSVITYPEMSDQIWSDFASWPGDLAFDWTPAAYPDPVDFYYNAFYPGATLNFQGVDDPELTALIEAGLAARDDATKRQAVEDLQRLFAVKLYWWPMPNWISENVYPNYLINAGGMKGSAGQGYTFLESWFTADAPARQ